MKLYTVGYEGCDIDEFTSALKKKKVKRVADVRKNPVSRKRGFSKKRLAEALFAVGIEYVHLPGLGVPTDWRKKAKANLITRKKMFQDYVKKVIPAQGEEIETVHLLMRKKGLALLCYEADASDCHRRYVAEKILKTDPEVEVVNLQVKPAVKSLRSRRDS